MRYDEPLDGRLVPLPPFHPPNRSSDSVTFLWKLRDRALKVDHGQSVFDQRASIQERRRRIAMLRCSLKEVQNKEPRTTRCRNERAMLETAGPAPEGPDQDQEANPESELIFNLHARVETGPVYPK